MNEDIKKIKASVDEVFDDVVSIRRHIHMNPDLSEQESATAEFISAKLDEMGIPYRANVAGHGVVAVIGGRNKGKAVGIRADMDALPVTEETGLQYSSTKAGVMHACGHDIHTSILLGTAKILKSMEDQLPASVTLLFQPSEETIGGAERMIEEGCLKSPDVNSVIGLHIDPEIETGKICIIEGPMNAASTEFDVKVTGVSCHGAHPDKGLDPLPPACAMITSLQSIITRRLNPAEAGLITVGQFHSGTKNNIIPSVTEFSGMLRAFTLENRAFLKSELDKVCKGTAAAYGAGCEVEFNDSYPSLENDKELYRVVKKAGEDILGSDKVQLRDTPSLGADDFAYFCHGSRGMYFDIGCTDKGDKAYPLHNEHLCPDEECMRTGMLVEVLSTLRILNKEFGND